ncbi:hypothetical protein GOV12_03030 [Candidatus Pacearchaeota archaeon]|nr:hypothetical protein [Candidatus Pacearchaeota archaeon]
MEKIFAIMYEFNKTGGEKGVRFELSVTQTTLEEDVYRMGVLMEKTPEEYVTVAGYKELNLDKGDDMFDYLREIKEKYGGREDGFGSLFLDESVARRLVKKEGFLDYLE